MIVNNPVLMTLNSDRKGAATPDAGSEGGSRTGRAMSGPQRCYPDLVTREPAADYKQVYGAAYSLISEWRTLWVGHSPLGKGLTWVSKRERILELEVTMLEEHGLTLTPETAPLRGLDRGDQLVSAMNSVNNAPATTRNRNSQEGHLRRIRFKPPSF